MNRSPYPNPKAFAFEDFGWKMLEMCLDQNRNGLCADQDLSRSLKIEVGVKSGGDGMAWRHGGGMAGPF